jgi:anti-sigma regulatory factor (Ser/Thr protein kinase)
VPGRPAYVRLARLVASGLAGDCGFTVEEIDDLRIAVDELVHAVMEDAPGIDIDLVYLVDDDVISVEGSRPGDGRVPHPDPLAAEILTAATDRWHVWADSERSRFALVKRTRYFV